jgi:hypothetical protein
MKYYGENITLLHLVNYWSVPDESLPECPVVLQYIGLCGALESCRLDNVHGTEGAACSRVKLFVETCVIIRVCHNGIIVSSLLTLTGYQHHLVGNWELIC